MCKISVTDSTISIVADYNTEAIRAFKNASGRWNPATSAWVFSAENTDVVSKICHELYGFFDETIIPRTTVILDLDLYPCSGNSLSLGGYRIAERRYRDNAVKLFHDAAVLEGGFYGSGGSMKNPHLAPKEGTKLRVAIPTALANRLIREDGVELAPTTTLDKVALTEEYAALKLRLAEVEALLNS